MMKESELIATIYRTVGESSQWQPALLSLMDVVDSQMAFLFVIDNNQRFRMSELQGLDQAALSPYKDYYAALDTHLHNAAKLPIGGIKAGYDLNGGPAFFESEFFCDFYSRLDLQWCMGIVLLNDEECYAGLGIHRNKGTAEYGANEINQLQQITPHLQLALKLHQRFEGLEAINQDLTSALEKLDSGFVIADQYGAALFVNSAAQQLASKNDGIKLSGGFLCAELHSETRHLMELVAKTANNTVATPSNNNGALRLSRSSGASPLAVSVMPLVGGVFQGVQARARVLIIIADPARQPQIPTSLIRQLYGLTSAEAQLACALLAGTSVSNYAAEHGIREVTVRNHLQAILHKTSTHRQAELIATLSKVIPRI